MARGLPRLCVDIDNVIALTDPVIRRLIQEHTGGRVCLAYGDVKEFNYHECQDASGNCITEEEWQEIHDAFSSPAVLSTVPPDAAALSALSELHSHAEIHVVTSRKPQGQTATLEWLKRHTVTFDEVMFVGHRKKHATLRPFFAAVEDDYDQAVEFAKKGTLCLLMRHPWNVGRPRMDFVQWVDAWPQAVTVLSSKLSGK